MMKKLSKDEMLLWILDKVKNSKDPNEAECWLVTARTLGANYDVEVSTYKLHCKHKNVKEAVETLQRMYVEFSTDDRFWVEVMFLIEAVRDDSMKDEMALFHRAVFQHLLPELQQTILLELAEKQPEKVDQCRYLLLLLRLCPDSASTFGTQLIDVLTDLEKTSEAIEPHENVYLQLLVFDVLPILLRSQTLKLTENVCLELFKRATRFYLSILSSTQQRRKQSSTTSGSVSTAGSSIGGTAGSSTASPRAPRFKSSTSRGSETPASSDYHYQDSSINFNNRANDNNWDQLLQCFAMIAERCRWEIGMKLKNFRLDHLKSIVSSLESSKSKSESAYTALLIFFNLVFKYSQLAGVGSEGEGPNITAVLVPPMLQESDFPNLLPPSSNDSDSSGPSPKKPKLSNDQSSSSKQWPFLASSETEKTLAELFRLGYQIYTKLLVDRSIRDDLMEKLTPKDKSIWIRRFIRDARLLNSNDQEILSIELDQQKSMVLVDQIQSASCHLAADRASRCVEILLAIDLDALPPPVNGSEKETSMGNLLSNSWHLAFITESQILWYMVRTIFYCLLKKVQSFTYDQIIKTPTPTSPGFVSDQLLGHLLILAQYEWPESYWLFRWILNDRLSNPKKSKFSYPKLCSYTFCMDVLEELASISARRSGQLVMDITETETTRKVGASTRHSVKGQFDDIRSVLETQASLAGDYTAREVFFMFLNEQKESLLKETGGI